ncbi:uncharacterized protein N7496_008005 [Penicillium cataractarum]|uniref:Cyclase n=1 Tax=Penicillium cataractarum TaxID=2100454 RepID=A0A9W9V6I5_9EURO|nr:uncharacterized protein N7496_008005 [Penicillium cataractarum]KAJ5368245.1 hypothetical protein N7496_008005 [Penicillium cataractarum]
MVQQQKPNQIPWDPNSTAFPLRNELPEIPGAPKEAAWVGRLNLLTPIRVQNAAKEIQRGEVIPVNLPLNDPSHPAFLREQFKHEIKTLVPSLVYDDTYHLNTQSGTQWDGFRHADCYKFAHSSGKFYNNITGADIVGPNANQKCAVHYWAKRGIAGRGVLLDYHEYAKKKKIRFDPYETCGISYEDIMNCGKEQGIDIRPESAGGDIQIGDILFIRSGWCEAYSKRSEETKILDSAKQQHQTFGGLVQEQAILDWLHDCYFAAVAGDSPSFEAWPTSEGYHLHEYILSLWGMPLSEMLQLDRLAERCHELNRWTFFFTSAPANCISGWSILKFLVSMLTYVDGVGTHVSGLAML